MGHDEVHIISHYIRSSRTCHVYLLAYGTNVPMYVKTQM